MKMMKVVGVVVALVVGSMGAALACSTSAACCSAQTPRACGADQSCICVAMCGESVADCSCECVGAGGVSRLIPRREPVVLGTPARLGITGQTPTLRTVAAVMEVRTGWRIVIPNDAGNVPVAIYSANGTVAEVLRAVADQVEMEITLDPGSSMAVMTYRYPH